MDIQGLTEEMHRFVRAQGWYETGSSRPQTLRNLAISLNLEASEVLEHFQWGETAAGLGDLAEELADVTLYLLQIASVAGINLEEAVHNKLMVNYQRSWDHQPKQNREEEYKDQL